MNKEKSLITKNMQEILTQKTLDLYTNKNPIRFRSGTKELRKQLTIEYNKISTKEPLFEYLKRNIAIISKKTRNKKYTNKHPEKVRVLRKKMMQNVRKKALLKISPNLKCIRCGCDDIRMLEINHKYGGGAKILKNSEFSSFTYMVLYGNVKIDDLELLCRPCNHIHFLEMKYNLKDTGLKVVWEKPKSN